MYSTEFDKDYVIKIIDEVKNEVELKLAHSNFEYMPRDVLQMIGNQNTQSMAKNEQKPTNSSDLANKKLVSLDIQYNKMQELEGALFLHLGLSGPIELRQIKASHNQIKYISSKIKDCVNLQQLKLSYNQLHGNEFIPVELLNSISMQNNLQQLHLAHNNIRELPTHLGKLKNLKVLDLVGNKLRQLYYKTQNKQGRQQYVCPLQGLESLEELYLNENRLKDLPCVFHHLSKLKIIGLDWFTYLAHPLNMPKILETANEIKLLQQNCEFHLHEKQNQYLTFKQFAQGFSIDKKYNINSQNEDLEMRTSLHSAVINNDRAMVNNLLKDGADPNIADFFQNTPLADALELENFEMAKLILKFAQKIDFSLEENKKLLLLAVTKLNSDIVESLLASGCDPNSQKDVRSGKNCLHYLMDQFQRAFENTELDELPIDLHINQSSQLNLRSNINTNKREQSPKTEMNQRVENSRNLTNEVLDETVLIENQMQIYDSKLDGTKQGFANILKKQNDAGRMEQISQRSHIQQQIHLMSRTNRDDMSSRRNFLNQSSELVKEEKELSDLQKCKNILDLLVQHGIDLNLGCNQKYTPFLYAVKLGNLRLINFLLNKYNRSEGPHKIDLNQTGSAWKNTAFHIAGMRSKFDIMYLLMDHGADIFIRSRDGKTCFQYVNNNLLMLKVVKKLERKQYLKDFIEFSPLIMPSEAQIICCYAVKLNTGSYKAIDWIIQRIKTEFFRPVVTQKRPSIFAKKQSGRASRQNSQARARENSISGHIKCTDRSNEEKYQRVTYVDFLTEGELLIRRPKHKYQHAESSVSVLNAGGRDSPRSNSVNFNLAMQSDQMSDITSTTKVRLSNVKIQNLNVSNWQESLKMYAGPKLNLDRSTIKSRKNLKLKNPLLDKQRTAKDNDQPFEQCDVIDTSRPAPSGRPHQLGNFADISIKDIKLNEDLSKTRQGKQAALVRTQASQREKIDSQIKINNFRNIIQHSENTSARQLRQKQQSEVSLQSSQAVTLGQRDSILTRGVVQQPKNSQNHKNIFFIKDQIFDKERMKQMQYNNQVITHVNSAETKPQAQQQEAEQQNSKASAAAQGTEKANEKAVITSFSLPSQHLEYQQGGFSFTYAHRHTQEMKLLSQLRATFNPRLKTHVTVMCEIVEKIYRLRDSPYMISEILDIVSMHLQSINVHSNDQSAKGSLESLLQAIQSLSENVNCPQFIQDQLDDLLQINHQRKPLVFINNEADIKDSMDGEKHKQFLNAKSENNLEHDLDGACDIDDVPSSKIGRYVQGHMQSDYATRRNPTEDIDIENIDSAKLGNQVKRRVSIKRMHSVDLKSVAIDFRKNPQARNEQIKQNATLKQQENQFTGSQEILGIQSVAHFDKNPLTNGRHIPFDKNLSHLQKDLPPYQDSGTIQGLESSGKVSIALSIGQIKIGQNARQRDGRAGKEDKGIANKLENELNASKFSDEFNQAEQVHVTNEINDGVDLKIKNLSTLSKRDYRLNSRGQQYRQNTQQSHLMNKVDLQNNRPLTQIGSLMNLNQMNQNLNYNVDRDRYSDWNTKTITSDQFYHQFNKVDVDDQFSPKTEQPPSQENKTNQIQATKKKLILKKADIKFKHQQLVASSRRNQSASRRSPHHNPHSLNNFESGKFGSQNVVQTGRSNAEFDRQLSQLSARNQQQDIGTVNVGKMGSLSALGLQEMESRSNPFNQQNQPKPNFDMRDIELKLQGTFESCESFNYQNKGMNNDFAFSDQSQRQKVASQQKEPSKQMVVYRDHHLKSQRDRANNRVLNQAESEQTIKQPQRSQIDKMMTPTRKGQAMYRFQQIKTTATLKFGANQKKIPSKKVSEIDLSKQNSLADKFAKINKQQSTSQVNMISSKQMLSNQSKMTNS